MAKISEETTKGLVAEKLKMFQVIRLPKIPR